MFQNTKYNIFKRLNNIFYICIVYSVHKNNNRKSTMDTRSDSDMSLPMANIFPTFNT